MPGGDVITTVGEIARLTGLNEEDVRAVVRALEERGVVARLEPGDRIVPGVQQGMSTSATPTTSVLEHLDPETPREVGPDYLREQGRHADSGDTKA